MNRDSDTQLTVTITGTADSHLDADDIANLTFNFQDAAFAGNDASLVINAVKNKRLYVLSNDYAFIPGPRFILFLEDLAKIIHPDIDWTD